MARQDYVLDGSRQFVFPFPVADATDMRLQLFPGTTVPQEDYTVTGAGPASQGVTITWPDAPTDPDVVLTISRQTPPERVSDFPNNQAVSARALNAEFDTIYQILDELGLSAEDILALIDQDTGQLIQLDNDDVGTVSPVLPAAQALNLLGWNGDGTSIINRTVADIQDETGNPVFVGTEDDEVPTNTDINGRGFAQSVDSVSTLRTTGFPGSLERLWLSGYYGVGTPGGGPLYRDSDDTASDDNGGTVFVDADGVRWKRPQKEEYTLYDFGGQENEDVLGVFERALEDGAYKFTVVIPSGTWFVEGTIRPLSGTKLVGQGDQSIITAPSTLGRDVSIIVTGDTEDVREDIYFSDFLIEFNEDRNSVEGGSIDYEFDSAQSCLVVSATENCVVERVRTVGGWKHGINISGASNFRDGSDALTYSPTPSKNVVLKDCESSRANDDCITTHMCTNVYLVRCVGRDAQAGFVGNSNAIEIDDGSRNIYIHDCSGIRCNKGLEIKGHDDTPAPYNVFVTGTFTAINCARSLHIDHIGFGGSGEPESETARNVYIQNFVSIAPMRANNEFTESVGHYRIISYDGVTIQSIIMTDGSEDLTDKDYDPVADMTGARLGHIFNGAKNTWIGRTEIYGSPEADFGIDVAASSGGGHYFGYLFVRDGQDEAIRFTTGAGTCYLMSYDIVGDQPSSTAIRASGDIGVSNYKYIGPGTVEGYEFAIRWDNISYADPVICSPVATVTP